MVPRGLEPRTLRLLAVRSNQLSYETCDISGQVLVLECSAIVGSPASEPHRNFATGTRTRVARVSWPPPAARWPLAAARRPPPAARCPPRLESRCRPARRPLPAAVRIPVPPRPPPARVRIPVPPRPPYARIWANQAHSMKHRKFIGGYYVFLHPRQQKQKSQ